MTYYHKCKNCAVDVKSCERRKNIRQSIQGLGITSLKFKCEDRIPLFRVGQRVEFSWTYYDEDMRDHYGECEADDLVFKGTVVCELEEIGKFIVRVDQDPVQSNIYYQDTVYTPKQVFRNGGFAVKVRPESMRELPEADRKICQDCFGYSSSEMCQKGDYINPSPTALCHKER